MTTNTSNDGPYIPICCDRSALSSPESSCYGNDTSFAEKLVIPQIYHSNFSISSMSPNEFVPRYGIPCMSNPVYCINMNSESVSSILTTYLFENGTTYVNSLLNRHTGFHVGYLLDIENYCFSPYVANNRTITVMSICASFIKNYTETHQYLSKFMETPPLTASNLFYIITLGLSLPFFVATFLVYTIIPELKNNHGFILRAYVACFFVTYVLIALSIADLAISCTYFLAFIMYFSALASFFWMNVGCFDTWLTFRSLKGRANQWNRKKIINYSIYAWGTSALICGVGAIIDFVPTLPEGGITPGFRGGCWITGYRQTGIYLNIPMGIIIICDICLLALTAININRQQKDTTCHLEGSESERHNDNKQRFYVYLKLFILMGIGWCSELTAFIDFGEYPKYIACILDVPITLQGVVIFVICVWNDKIKRLLLKRLGCNDRNIRERKSRARNYCC